MNEINAVRPRLSAATLPSLGAGVAVPTYDRSEVQVGIVHLGVGGFSRSHQAAYLDALLRAGLGGEWGICGIGLLPGDAAMAAALQPQDGLYTLVTKDTDGSQRSRVIGSILRYIHAPTDPAAAYEALTSSQTRIVTLTVTEGGYNIDPRTGKFAAGVDAIVADVADVAAEQKRTVFGWVVEALRRRRAAGIAPFTVVSCDNIRGNGDVARTAFTRFAELCDAELGRWVADNVAFPNSMVDRITPVTTDDDRAEVERLHGYLDAWPVVCEPFVQWVLEDRFSAGRPPLEEVGVQVVDDVEPYELMKLYLLNGSHQALAHWGRLAGTESIHDVIGDPVIATLVRKYALDEVTPILRPVPGIDLAEYREGLITRFANAQIRDSVARVGAYATDRLAGFVLPVLNANLAAGGPIDIAVLILAAWARGVELAIAGGRSAEVVDHRAAEVLARGNRQRVEPLALMAMRVFGEVADDARFAASFTATLNALREGPECPASDVDYST